MGSNVNAKPLFAETNTEVDKLLEFRHNTRPSAVILTGTQIYLCVMASNFSFHSVEFLFIAVQIVLEYQTNLVKI